MRVSRFRLLAHMNIAFFATQPGRHAGMTRCILGTLLSSGTVGIEAANEAYDPLEDVDVLRFHTLS